ncbi:MAG TPA: hypothetical protein VK835_02115, partial [Bacteroidia bacterium]|nr:hypothetical protein [Bacteroidia bacterium]
MVLVFTCIVGSLNAQTIAKHQKSLKVLHKKIKQSNGLRTTSTPTYCPSGPVTFNAYDTNNVTVGNATGATLTCNSRPFYIDADNSGDVVTPCILSEYTSTDPFLPNNGTEYFYEGGVNTFCLGNGSTGCSFPIGSGGFDANHQWGVLDIFSDPSLQHNYTFCYTGLTLINTSIQLQDCWSGDSLFPTKSFGLNTLGTNCFTDSVLANTDIGTATFSIAPASASVALIDYHNGEAYIDPSLLSAGSYTVTYSFKPPATDSCPTITGTYTISVPAISVTVNNTTICAGSSATLTASGPAAATYSWSPATNLNTTTGATVVATPTTVTTSIYTVTATKGSCTAMATSTITINPTPTLAVNSPSICVGNSATLTASGATTYTWSPTSGLSTTTGSTVTTNTLSSNAVYTVNATSLGCTSKATTTVTVNGAPSLSVNSATICAGSTATLTATGATTYTWNTTATNASITSSPTITTNYTVTGTSGSCSAIKTTTVTVNTLPTISVNSATICAGSSATLTASGPPAIVYSWSPATNLSATSGATVTATPTAATNTYTVTGTKAGCSAMATSTVMVNSIPNLVVNSPSVC